MACLQIAHSLKLQSLVGRMALSFCYSKDIFFLGISSPVFNKQKENQSHHAPAILQVPLPQNSQYA
jgi:hypothetical protein